MTIQVLETGGYKVHFFETPEDELVELSEDEVMEEQVLSDGTPIFAFLEDTQTWYDWSIVHSYVVL